MSSRLVRVAAALVGVLALCLGSLAVTSPAESAPRSGSGLLIADNLGKRIVITDLDGGLVWQMQNPTGNSSKYAGPLGVRWMSGGKILATFGTGEVGQIDVATKKFDWMTKGYNQDWFQSPYDAQLLPDGNLAVATRYNEGGRVTVYNRSTGAVVWKKLMSNAHSLLYRTPAESYNSAKPTLLIGGFGSNQEVTYQPGKTPKVVWQTTSEYTHDIMPVPGGTNLMTSEGYYIRQIDRSGKVVWRKDTPQEDRRFAVNPNGGYIVSSGEGDVIEFRDSTGKLLRSWSTLSDGSKLDYPYGIRAIDLGTVPGG